MDELFILISIFLLINLYFGTYNLKNHLKNSFFAYKPRFLLFRRNRLFELQMTIVHPFAFLPSRMSTRLPRMSCRSVKPCYYVVIAVLLIGTSGL